MTRYLAFLAVAVVATISFIGFQGKTTKKLAKTLFLGLKTISDTNMMCVHATLHRKLD